MKRYTSIGEAAARTARHRQWLWCRRENGFSDKPIWRVVAAQLSLPVFQVAAFANRLEELANKAEHRGSVSEFNAAEFGAALGMLASDAALIFECLASADVGWISSEHIADFYGRNSDREDETANERQRRKRAREKVLKSLAELARRGGIEPALRNQLEAKLMLFSDADLFALLADLDRALRTGATYVFVTRDAPYVTRDSRLSQSDDVTVTLEQSRFLESPSVENFEDGDRRGAAGLQQEEQKSIEQALGEAWLAADGLRIVMGRLEADETLARTRIGGWRRELRTRYPEGDAAALMHVVVDADRAGYVGARFHNLIVDGIRRYRQSANGPQLPFGPALAASNRSAG